MKKELILKIIKIILMVIALACFVMLLYFWFTGIKKSLFENDVKTAQNRIASSYQFLKMLIAGVSLLIVLTFIYNIKVQVLPDKLAIFFGFKQKEDKKEEVVDENKNDTLDEAIEKDEDVEDQPFNDDESEKGIE